MNKILIFFLSIGASFLLSVSSAQESNSKIIITSSGRGESQSEAQKFALRSAVEQAYGAFISSKTEILNDEIVLDQMASVASGNIQSFEILSETELPDYSWVSTIKAVVSVEKLTNFVQSKGIEVEIKGGLFAANVKQQMLNEKGELEAIYNMVCVLHEVMQTSFNYRVKSENPKSQDSSNENWHIPLEIIVMANNNIEIGIQYFMETLEALNLSNDECKIYLEMNKKVYSINARKLKKINFSIGGFVYEEKTETITLRNQKSLEIISTFFELLPSYISNYTITINSRSLDMKVNPTQIIDSRIPLIWDGRSLDLRIKNNSPIMTRSFKDNKSLVEIEKMNGYNIKSNGLKSKFSDVYPRNF
jgi:hypothetical protein